GTRCDPGLDAHISRLSYHAHERFSRLRRCRSHQGILAGREQMRRHLSILSGLALSLSLVGVAAPANSATLRIGIGEDTDTLDPAQGRTFGGRQIFAALCDKLFDLDPNAKVVGQLVTDWA